MDDEEVASIPEYEEEIGDIEDTQSTSDNSNRMDKETDQEELQNLRDVIPSPYEDDVFTPPLDEEAKKTSEVVKQKWVRIAQSSLEKNKSDEEQQEEFELPSQKHSTLDSEGRPRRLDFRQRKRRKRVQSIFLDNEEHMVYKPTTGKTPTTPKFANLVFNLMAQQQSAEATAPSPTPSNIGSSLKDRREQFEWSIKTTQEVVKQETEELNKVDELHREKKTLRAVTRKLTERMKEEKTPKMANLVGEVMKIASSAPTSFDEDTKEKETPDECRQRASSTTGVSGMSAHHVSRPVKRRQRQESSSHLLGKFLDIGKHLSVRYSHNNKSIVCMIIIFSFYTAVNRIHLFLCDRCLIMKSLY